MEDIFVSIIIPVFNGKHLVSNAIDSFLNSNVDCSKYEIIVIDDGSTDGTSKFLKDKYLNKIKLITKSNGGPSSARNEGIKVSKGSFLLFVDADDRVNTQAFERLFKAHIGKDGAILEINKETKSGVDKKPKFKSLSLIDKMNFHDALIKMPKVLDSSCNVLYNKKIILENNLFFKEKTFCEDLLFNVIYFRLVNEISYVPGDYYYYSMDNNVNSRSKAINSIGLCSAILNYFDVCSDFIAKEDSYSNVCRMNVSKYFPILLGYLGHTEKDYFSKVQPLLIKYFSYFKICSVRTFICRLLLIFGFRFASLIFKKCIK